MRQEIRTWLPGWTVLVHTKEISGQSVYERYRDKCEWMRRIGKELFERGALPSLRGTVAPARLQNGTGGNFAVRDSVFPNQFIVTASGTHKGQLKQTDFVEVISIDWKKVITICTDSPGALPSTDSLLVATVFEMYPEICAWIHFHETLHTPHIVKLEYPSISPTDRNVLSDIIQKGARAINMIDHDLFAKKIADGTADAAIILGKNQERAFSHAIELLALASARREKPR